MPHMRRGCHGTRHFIFQIHGGPHSDVKARHFFFCAGWWGRGLRRRGRMEKRKMEVVVLCGRDGSGKTETLKSFIQTVMGKGAIKLVSQPHPDSDKDEIAVFTYLGKMICVSTYGDDASGINKGYQVARNQKCDVFVTATRGETNSPSLGEACRIARGDNSYPLLLSAYREEDLNDRGRAMTTRVNTLLRVVKPWR